MSHSPLSTEELFRKYGKANPAPNIGQRVLIERGGKSDEAAFALGEIISRDVSGARLETRLIVKELQIHFADGRVTTPHRSPVILPFDHFAAPIQERMRARAKRLAEASEQYLRWAN